MNKRGFSLIELITVMVIILILFSIGMIAYGRLSLNNKQKLNKNLNQTIEGAASNYCANPKYFAKCNIGQVTIGDLKEEGLIDGEIINYVEEVPLCMNAKVKIVSEEYNYIPEFSVDNQTTYDQANDCLWNPND